MSANLGNMENSSGDYCSRRAISASRNGPVSDVSWVSFTENPQDDRLKGQKNVEKPIFTTSQLLLKSKKHQICDDFGRILSVVPGTLD